jgi:hypothetical protein
MLSICMFTGATVAIDVLERNDLPFPRSLPEFQRLFPNEARLAQPILDTPAGTTGSCAVTAA